MTGKKTQLLLQGTVAGLAATLPMTVVMEIIFHRLPLFQRYPLPPSQIVSRLYSKRQESEHRALTFLGHFSYGAAAGALYGLLFKSIPLSWTFKGGVFGVMLWFIGYQGWLPVLGILPSASKSPRQRNLLMIVAHVIWGSITAVLMEISGSRKQPH